MIEEDDDAEFFGEEIHLFEFLLLMFCEARNLLLVKGPRVERRRRIRIPRTILSFPRDDIRSLFSYKTHKDATVWFLKQCSLLL